MNRFLESIRIAASNAVRNFSLRRKSRRELLSSFLKAKNTWIIDDFPKDLTEEQKTFMKHLRFKVSFDDQISSDQYFLEYHPEDMNQFRDKPEEFCFESMGLFYTKIHLGWITKRWGDFDKNSKENLFSTWLPNFYEELLLYLEEQWKWGMVACPEDYKSLVPKLLMETMVAVEASFVTRINIATGDVVPETKALGKGISDILSGHMPMGIKIQTKHLEVLIELQNKTQTFARNIQLLFSESDLQVLMDTLKSVYLPYESFKQRYGQMEHAILSAEIAEVGLRGAESRGVGAQGIELSETVRRMKESIPQVFVLLEAAVERCVIFTGGSEADELIIAVDDIMVQYVSMMQQIVELFRKEMGLDGQSSQRWEEATSILQGALQQLLTVADCLTSRSSGFEASLRARLSTALSVSVFGSSADQNLSNAVSVFGSSGDQNLSNAASDDGNVEPSLGGRAAFDAAAVRFNYAPEKARKLFILLCQSKDGRFLALPLASQRVAAFADTVDAFVYDARSSLKCGSLSD